MSRIRNNHKQFKLSKTKKTALITGAILAATVPLSAFAIANFDQVSNIFAAGCDPKAILGDNNNLNFVCDNTTYTPGETYTDNIGSTTITNVWEVPANSTSEDDIGWSKNDNIHTANFSDSFHSFQPTSAKAWFYEDKMLSTVTNPENFDTSQVTTMYNTFYYAGQNAPEFVLDLTSWDVSQVTTMTAMFASTGQNADVWNVNLSGWNASKTTDASGFFSSAAVAAETADVVLNMEGINFDSLNYVGGMFSSLGASAHSVDINLANSTFAKVTSLGGFFSGVCSSPDVETCKIDLTNTNLSNVTSAGGFASGLNAKNLTLEASGLKLNKIISLSGFLNGFGSGSRESVTVNLANLETDNMTEAGYSMSGLGQGTTGKVEINMSGWNTSKVQYLSSMFASVAQNASEVVLDFSGWDTSNVTSIGAIFAGFGKKAKNLTLDLSDWNTQSINSAYSVFSDALTNVENLKLDVSGWDMGSMSSFPYAFFGGICRDAIGSCTLDASDWKVRPGVSLYGLFAQIGANMPGDLTIDLSGWDTSEVSSMGNMFEGTGTHAKNFVFDLTGWSFSNVTNMDGMFTGSGATIIDISDWNTSNVTNMNNMFKGAPKLTTIIVGDGWNTDNVGSSTGMFDGDSFLVGDRGTVYDSSKIDKEYARLDEGADNPGYLSTKKNITINSPEGISVKADRIASPAQNPGLADATETDGLGLLNNGDSIYYRDEIKIEFAAAPNCTIIKHNVNGSEFTSGDTITVDHDSITIDAEAICIGGGVIDDIDGIPVPNTGAALAQIFGDGKVGNCIVPIFAAVAVAALAAGLYLKSVKKPKAKATAVAKHGTVAKRKTTTARKVTAAKRTRAKSSAKRKATKRKK